MTNDEPTPAELIAKLDQPRRREEAEILLPFFQEVTGFAPVLWRESIVGYGRYDYKYDSGREGTYLATGFAPRKGYTSIYILPGYQDYSRMLARLGPHKAGKACLNITRLDRIDMGVLKELIETGLRDLGKIYPVSRQ
ncbi:MAG: DUF1801 domain-containing protein [Pseudomonadota bacterium]